MIKLNTIDVYGFEPAIHGMRNPKNSWDKSDSSIKYRCSEDKEKWCDLCGYDACNPFIGDPHFVLGDNDKRLAMQLAGAGPVHGKFRRMITVWVDITAPLYWWKEFDTYKVGTVANSCSTMHKIHARELTLDDFSHEHLLEPCIEGLEEMIDAINICREKFIETQDKQWWWQMIQLLPTSYNQTRTVQLNYEVLANIYQYRRGHKLDEWADFIRWSLSLPYPELFTGEKKADQGGDPL